MPAACASCGDDHLTFAPSKRSSPSSGVSAPAMILISVDLPAPFSPTSARTSPVETEKSTRSSDRTPGKDLEMALTSTTIEGFWELQGVGEAPGRTMTYARQAHVTSGSR